MDNGEREREGFVRRTDLVSRVPDLLELGLRKNGPFFEFLHPYVGPEPVLVKCLFLHINGSKRPFLLTGIMFISPLT
eukprot:COSAG06_NODE_447_length_15632_cov_47.212193_8_plen_77_part_00